MIISAEFNLQIMGQDDFTSKEQELCRYTLNQITTQLDFSNAKNHLEN